VNAKDQERLLEFLRKKMCGKCRRGALTAQHDGCHEAAELIEIVEACKS
jgi:hypothetical protein